LKPRLGKLEAVEEESVPEYAEQHGLPDSGLQVISGASSQVLMEYLAVVV